jgi:hypothetical protein
MFRLNRPVLVSDLVEALKKENGCFQITSPCGEQMQIQLNDGFLIVECVHCAPERMRDDSLWEIVKLGESRCN